ncbi:MAG: hypothetical protein U0667_15375 [Chloroflexota bacterium]
MQSIPPIRTAEQQRVEHAHGAPVDELIRRLYVQEGLTQPEVAARLAVSTRTVIRWMAALGIPTRDRRAVQEAVA